MPSWLSLIMCIAAFVAAMHFPPAEWREAMISAAVLLANWAMCEWTYTHWSLYYLFGIAGSAPFVWMTADAIFGAVTIVAAFDRRWGWAIWSSTLAQEVVHFLHFDMLPNWLYLPALDALLIIQCAIFMAGGADGVLNRCRGYLDRSRFRRRALPSISSASRRDQESER